jgi:hypothetical protein
LLQIQGTLNSIFLFPAVSQNPRIIFDSAQDLVDSSIANTFHATQIISGPLGFRLHGCAESSTEIPAGTSDATPGEGYAESSADTPAGTSDATPGGTSAAMGIALVHYGDMIGMVAFVICFWHGMIVHDVHQTPLNIHENRNCNSKTAVVDGMIT